MTLVLHWSHCSLSSPVSSLSDNFISIGLVHVFNPVLFIEHAAQVLLLEFLHGHVRELVHAHGVVGLLCIVRPDFV